MSMRNGISNTLEDLQLVSYHIYMFGSNVCNWPWDYGMYKFQWMGGFGCGWVVGRNNQKMVAYDNFSSRFIYCWSLNSNVAKKTITVLRFKLQCCQFITHVEIMLCGEEISSRMFQRERSFIYDLVYWE